MINGLKVENNCKNEKINEDEQTINSMEAEIEKLKNYTEQRVEEAKAESTTSESSEVVQGSTEVSSESAVVEKLLTNKHK